MDQLEKRNEKLLTLENSYARAYSASRILLWLTIIAFIGILFAEKEMDVETYQVVIINAAIWASVYGYARSKLDHIETIKRYRTTNDNSN